MRNSAAAIGLYLGLLPWMTYLVRAALVGDRNRPGLAWTVLRALRGRPSFAPARSVLGAVAKAPGDLRRLRRGPDGPLA
ncbi:hypothetical protein [Nocardioides zeae]